MGFRIQDPPLGIFIHKEPINMIKAHLLNFQTVWRGSKERGHISQWLNGMIKLTLFSYWEMIKLSSELVRKFSLLSFPHALCAWGEITIMFVKIDNNSVIKSDIAIIV